MATDRGEGQTELDLQRDESVGVPEDVSQAVGKGYPQPLLQPGRNCWRMEEARRVAWVIDGEEYFPAAKQAILNTRRSIMLLAWDFADDVSLEPDDPDASRPDRIGDLLQFVAEQRPDLQVRVLVWSKALLLAPRRQKIPGVQTIRMRHGPVIYRLDNQHPHFCSHHQKVLVVDDAVAFCGGFDFADNRWDTRRHLPEDRRRRKPSGKPYTPHHDVMMVVDGPAAAALGDLARRRWLNATGEELVPPPVAGDPWPDGLRPRLTDVAVAIARTAPSWRQQPRVEENKQLYLDAIAAAKDTIYLESQYFASHEIGEALRLRLGEADGPEIVLVNPKWSPALPEELAMDSARTKIVKGLREADRFDRFRIYVSLTDGKEVVVHSKVMIIDDRILRIGSANLNQRSMGADSECDLAIEAAPGAPNETDVRQAAIDLRNTLLGDHLGVEPGLVARTLAKEKSLIRTVERLDGSSYRRLREFPEPHPMPLATLAHDRFTDPAHPPRFGGALPWGMRIALGAAVVWGIRKIWSRARIF